MRGFRVAIVALALAVCVAWFTSLALNVGVLVWSYTAYQDEVYLYDPSGLVAPPTYGPVGERCTYLTYAGARDVLLVDPDEYNFLLRQIEEDADIIGWARGATLTHTTGPEICSPTYKFDRR